MAEVALIIGNGFDIDMGLSRDSLCQQMSQYEKIFLCILSCKGCRTGSTISCAGWAFLASGTADTASGTADTATGIADMRKSGRTF